MNGRVVVIIGGTTGMGRASAELLLERGARVVAVGLDEESCKATAELGTSVKAFCAEARDPDAAKAAVQMAVDTFGKLDGLFHVAGGSGRSKGDGPLHAIRDEGVDYTLSLNLASVIYSNRAAVCRFLEQESSGVILNMGSVMARSPSPGFFATHVYAAAKAGIEGLTLSAASYYASHDIRFNVLSPGLMETPMSARACGDKTVREFVHRKQPLDGGRVGRAEDVAEAALFLLSERSRFITGQVVNVDGGWSVSEGTTHD